MQTDLRFVHVQEIKNIFKYKDCLKVLRIVICKYKDFVVIWMLTFNPPNQSLRCTLNG